MGASDDRSARLEEALEHWGDAVYRLALCHTGSPHDAEDVAQSVFLSFYEKFECANDSEHAKAWLLRATINCCKNLKRTSWASKTTRMPAEDIAALRPGGIEADDAFSSGQNPISDALATLSDKQRTAVHLFYGEGYKTDEIATLTGERPATVRSHLKRARERLRKILGEDYDWT